MARSIPDTDPETMPHHSEAVLMTAFQKMLGDEYLIFHSFPWLFPGRDDAEAPAREGEADFVILHRTLGILVIEAKGGECVLRQRQWYRVVKGGVLKDLRDPAQQVRRACRALKKRIEQVCGKPLAEKIRFATAVAFPHCVFRDEPPADLPVQAIMTSDDLLDIDQAVNRAYAAYGASKGELTPAEFEAVRSALAPEFALYEPIKVSVDYAADELSRLTRQQIQILSGFNSNSRAIIHGVAGSGKTLLAIQRAKNFADAGRLVLFTCFNAELANWVDEQLSAENSKRPGTITVRHFHGLAADLFRAAGGALQPTGDLAKYWDEIVPDQMAAIATTIYPNDSPYNALVVDEAQDFSPGWWDALAYLTGLSDDIPMWAFLDRAQSLRRDPVDPPIKGAFPFGLDFNCRNTRRIVAFATEASRVATEPFDLAPLGRPVRFASAVSQAAIPGIVQSEVRRLIGDHRLRPDQIAIIGPTSLKNGVFGKWSEISGIPLTESARDWRAQKGLLCTTARSFKGLEADVVILYDLNGVGLQFTESDLYVALTRARSHLVIVASQNGFSEALQGAAARTSALLDEALLP